MIESVLQGLMYPFIFLSIFFQVLLLVSFFENKKKIKEEEELPFSYFPSVTICVPCWNEEGTLSATLDSLLQLDYPKEKLSIIIVDNNSKDRTMEVACGYKRRFPSQIEVLEEKNQGKHHAVNKALYHSSSEFFGCLDADSFADKKSLKTLVSYFKDDSIVAVTPCMHIWKPRTLVQRMQAIEYLMGIFLRKAFGQLDAIQVTPGPFSIFRRSIFDWLGPYRKAHNTEDFEITLRIHRAKMRIANAHKALVYTMGPSTARGYFLQRLRWVRGFLENSLDYRELFFKKKYGNFGMFTLPSAFAFIFYGTYAIFFMLYLSLSHMVDVVERWLTVGIQVHMPTFDPFYFNTTVISFLGMVIFTMLLFALYIANTLSDDRQEFYKNFPVYFILYPLFIPFILIRSIFDTFMKRKNDWVLQDNKAN